MLGVGLLLALGPVLWVYFRHRRATPLGRFRALMWVTLFLTFDLVLFGAFTRLSDSGLGCPDWPGCYGNASPLGAHADIAAAQTAMPSGPVTHSKAWVEMAHRYLATGVGALSLVLMVWAWVAYWLGRKGGAQYARHYLTQERTAWINPWWPTVTLVWVCIQGAFGALTVTMKLFPAIVTLHLLGGYALLALLTVQVVLLTGHGASAVAQQPALAAALPRLPASLKGCLWLGLAVVLLLQAASGAWVSTNYAVLACTEFPQCQGVWVPSMNFAQGFEIWRPLGLSGAGHSISFQALTAIHFVHRTLAVLTVLVLGAVAYQAHRHATLRRPARWLLGLLVLQLMTGLSNVVLGWPMLAAVLHTGGAGALLAVLSWLLAVAHGNIPAAIQASPAALADLARPAPLQPRFSE
jgi:heme a synthase